MPNPEPKYQSENENWQPKAINSAKYLMTRNSMG